MNAEQEKALREPFPDTEIGKLPRVTCKNCRETQGKVCQQHSRQKCSVCDNYITTAHLHLDYVGHAETTDRLLAVDPSWSWEPIGWGADGTPLTMRHGANLVMWGRLTVCGVTRLGVGTAPAAKEDAHKELIGDFLRNAAMRFGVALDLWRKSERVEHEDDVSDHPRETASADEHQILRTAIAGLDDSDKALLVSWWNEHHYPNIKDSDVLTKAEVEAAFDFLDTLHAQREARRERAIQVADEAGLTIPEAQAIAERMQERTRVESHKDKAAQT